MYHIFKKIRTRRPVSVSSSGALAISTTAERLDRDGALASSTTEKISWHCVLMLAMIFFADANLAFCGEPDFESRNSDLTFEQAVVRAAVSVELSAQEPGTIQSSHVRVNQSVSGGDVVLELDNQAAELAVEQAKDELQRARAAIEKAKAIVTRSKNGTQHRRDDLERHLKLGDSISDAERRGLLEAVENAEIEHVVTYNDYLQAKHLADVGEVKLREAEMRLARMKIVAPFNGEITRVLVHPGERVELGEPVVELRSMERMLAEFQIPEDSANLPALIGRPVEIETIVTGTKHQLSGIVVSADSEVSARGTIRLHVEIGNQLHENRWILLHGKSVTLRVLLSE